VLLIIPEEAQDPEASGKLIRRQRVELNVSSASMPKAHSPSGRHKLVDGSQFIAVLQARVLLRDIGSRSRLDPGGPQLLVANHYLRPRRCHTAGFALQAPPGALIHERRASPARREVAAAGGH